MILFVDDEEEMDSYRMGLELSDHEVVLITKLDEAWSYFNSNLDRMELVILDISMPPGKFLEDYDTKAGLRTGVVFYDKLREIAPSLPIIIFTNVSDEKVRLRFDGVNNCLFLNKTDELPRTLAERVGEMLPRSVRTGR